ncbi:MAG: RDD family protein [Anaerolineae bacterium]|nr:RDD family protein [Anaerolineae bacterium]
MPPDSSAPALLGQYAGFVTRLIAFATDQLLVLGIILTANTLVMLVLSFFQVTVSDVFSFSGSYTDLPQLARILAVGVAFLLNVSFYVGYFIVFWLLVGQTPGKMLMGVRVVSFDGRPLSLIQAIKRLLGYYLSMLPFFLGFIWVLVSDTRQGWHDKIAHTYVIYTWQATPNFRFWRRLSHAAEKRARRLGSG